MGSHTVTKGIRGYTKRIINKCILKFNIIIIISVYQKL